MAKLYDEICRTLATPMPRSRALKLIFGGLASAVLAPFGFGQQQLCEDGSVLCTGVPPNNCCPPANICCQNRAGNNHCCPPGSSCCGDTCCPNGRTCTANDDCLPPSNSRP